MIKVIVLLVGFVMLGQFLKEGFLRIVFSLSFKHKLLRVTTVLYYTCLLAVFPTTAVYCLNSTKEELLRFFSMTSNIALLALLMTLLFAVGAALLSHLHVFEYRANPDDQDWRDALFMFTMQSATFAVSAPYLALAAGFTFARPVFHMWIDNTWYFL